MRSFKKCSMIKNRTLLTIRGECWILNFFDHRRLTHRLIYKTQNAEEKQMNVSFLARAPVAYSSPSNPAHLNHVISHPNNLTSNPVYYSQTGQSPEGEAIDRFSGKLLEMLMDRNEPSEGLVGKICDYAIDKLAELFAFLRPKLYPEENAYKEKRNTLPIFHKLCDETGTQCSLKATDSLRYEPNWRFYLFRQLPLPAPETLPPGCINTDYQINLGEDNYVRQFRMKLSLSDCSFSLQQQNCITEALGILSPFSSEFVGKNIFETNSTVEDPVYSFKATVPSVLTNATWEVKVYFMETYKKCNQSGCFSEPPFQSFAKTFIKTIEHRMLNLTECEIRVIKTQIITASLGTPLLIFSGIGIFFVHLFRKRAKENHEKTIALELEYGTFP